MSAGTIRVGIGGWDYEPWRETFYPPGLPKAKQLGYAASKLSAIEINATYYKLQKPDLFAKWAKAVPDGFKFALKGSRYCSNRKLLGEGGEAIERFCGQGFTELGDRLGPIVWQLMATKTFDPDDMRAFLKLLPNSQDGVALQHVVEPRHESFRDPAFIAMAREAEVGIVHGDSADYPSLADLGGGDIAYARLMCAQAEVESGYEPTKLNHWADVAHCWAAGESPPGLPGIADPTPRRPRDTYLFFIAGAKERNPAAAMALIDRL